MPILGQNAFFTREAVHNIALTTLQNILDYSQGKELVNEVLKTYLTGGGHYMGLLPL